MNTLRILSKIQDLQNDLIQVKINERFTNPTTKDDIKYWELAKQEYKSKINILMEIVQND